MKNSCLLRVKIGDVGDIEYFYKNVLEESKVIYGISDCVTKDYLDGIHVIPL